MTMDIVNPLIDKYLDGLLPPREPWFLEMEQMAKSKAFPAVGPKVGRLLEFNRILKDHPGFVTSWLPLRDGVSVSVKI